MELKIIAVIAASAFAGAVALLWGVVQVYKRLDNPAVQDHLRPLLYLIDEAADNLEIAQKRAQVIMAIQQALAWKRVFLPGFMVGLFLDLLVKIVRKTGVPDLHTVEANKDESMP